MRVWAFSFTVEDEKGQKSVMRLHAMSPGDTITQDPKLYAGWMAANIDNIITGRIVNITYTERVSLPATLKAVAATNSDVEEGGLFIFKTNVRPAHLVKIRFPTMDEAYFVDGRFGFNDGDPVDIWLENLLAGSYGPEMIRGSDARGEELTHSFQVFESFKPSRSG